MDAGKGIEDETSPVAKEALEFMALSVTKFWKVAYAYFLIDRLNGVESLYLNTVCIQ